MSVLIAGLILFFVPHSIAIVNDAWRDRAAARLGETAWQGLYALLSLAGLVLIVQGYGLAREDPVFLFIPAYGLRYVTLLLMLPVFPLLIAAYLPGRIRDAVRHPMLVAVMFWAAAHLPINGTLADLLLFGSFLVWAVADRVSLRRRPGRPVPTLPASRLNDVVAVVVGLGLYAAFLLGLHGWLFGTPPMIGF